MKFIGVIFAIFCCCTVTQADSPAAVKLKNEYATIQLGPQGDVTISRKGKRKLEIDAMVTTESLALPAGANMMIGGVLLEDYIKQLARKIIAASPPPKPAATPPKPAATPPKPAATPPKPAATPPKPAAIPTAPVSHDRCTWKKETGKTLYGCPKGGCQLSKSLEDVMEMCNKDESCVGFVKMDKGTSYGTRGQGSKANRNGSSAWSCLELTCTKFPLQRGSSERERCEGGNALRRGYEYLYKSKGCDCTCCRRPRANGVDPTLPKIMTILIVNVDMTDYHPQFGTLKHIENQVFGGEGDDATGEIKGAFAHMLDTSTLGRVTAPRSASAVVNVKLGKDMMWKNWRNEPQASKRCPVDDLSAAAIKEVEKEQDFDVDVYDFHMFFLPDDNDVNRQSCTFYGMAENGCGTLDILPLSIGLNRRGQKRAKCKSWYFSDSRATLAHELTHNLGAGHAVAPKASVAGTGYDPAAIVGYSYTFTDYLASTRYEIGTAKEVPGEVLVWERGTKKVVTLRSISSPFDAKFYNSIRIPCPDCKTIVRNPSVYRDGGNLFVAFRGDQGYSSYKLDEEWQNTVWVHLNRKVDTKYFNEWGTHSGKGSEVWGFLQWGASYNNTELGLAVTFCQINDGLATVSLGTDIGETTLACPNYSKENGITTPRPEAPDRCRFVEIGAKKMVDGYISRKKYETLDDAKYYCNVEDKCTAIYQNADGKFELRSGTRFYSNKGKSWACHGYSASGKVFTEPTENYEPKTTTAATTTTTTTVETVTQVCVTNGKGVSGKTVPAGTPCTGFYYGKAQGSFCATSGSSKRGWCGVEAPLYSTGNHPFKSGSGKWGECSVDCPVGGIPICTCLNGVAVTGAACTKHGRNICKSCNPGFEPSKYVKTACIKST